MRTAFYSCAAGALAGLLTCLVFYIRLLCETDKSATLAYALSAIAYSAVIGPCVTLCIAMWLSWRAFSQEQSEAVFPEFVKQDIPEWGSNYRD